jgi:hypothetical protein
LSFELDIKQDEGDSGADSMEYPGGGHIELELRMYIEN